MFWCWSSPSLGARISSGAASPVMHHSLSLLHGGEDSTEWKSHGNDMPEEVKFSRQIEGNGNEVSEVPYSTTDTF